MNCGALLPETANYCYKCGVRQLSPQKEDVSPGINNQYTYSNFERTIEFTDYKNNFDRLLKNNFIEIPKIPVEKVANKMALWYKFEGNVNILFFYNSDNDLYEVAVGHKFGHKYDYDTKSNQLWKKLVSCVASAFSTATEINYSKPFDDLNGQHLAHKTLFKYKLDSYYVLSFYHNTYEWNSLFPIKYGDVEESAIITAKIVNPNCKIISCKEFEKQLKKYITQEKLIVEYYEPDEDDNDEGENEPNSIDFYAGEVGISLEYRSDDILKSVFFSFDRFERPLNAVMNLNKFVFFTANLLLGVSKQEWDHLTTINNTATGSPFIHDGRLFRGGEMRFVHNGYLVEASLREGYFQFTLYDEI